MDPMALTELREIMFDLLGPELRPESKAEFEAEWGRLHRKAAQLGLEVLDCEERGLSYAAGARRPGDWPTLARAHYGILDLLHDEIPSELLVHFRAFAARARLLDAEGFGQDLLVAAAHDRTASSALVRFAIYELIRLNLWLLTWDRPGFEALGAMAEIDVKAQRILQHRLGDPMTYDPSVRPLVVLVAEALFELVKIAREKKEDLLVKGGTNLRDFYEGLTEAARLARELSPHTRVKEYAKT